MNSTLAYLKSFKLGESRAITERMDYKAMIRIASDNGMTFIYQRYSTVRVVNGYQTYGRLKRVCSYCGR